MHRARTLSGAFIKYLKVALLLISIIIGGQPFYVYAQNIDRGGLRSLTSSHGLSDLLVNTIFKDCEGYVWFGTESSVDRFDGNRIERFAIPGNKQKSRRVMCIVETPDHTIYVGTQQGLFSIRKGEWQLQPVFADRFGNRCFHNLCRLLLSRSFIEIKKIEPK